MSFFQAETLCYFSIICQNVLGLALKCMTCGEEGICDGGPEVSKECEETSKNCILSKVKIGNKTYDMKDCFVAPNGLNEAMRGCVHFSNNQGVCHPNLLL